MGDRRHDPWPFIYCMFIYLSSISYLQCLSSAPVNTTHHSPCKHAWTKTEDNNSYIAAKTLSYMTMHLTFREEGTHLLVSLRQLSQFVHPSIHFLPLLQGRIMQQQLYHGRPTPSHSATNRSSESWRSWLDEAISTTSSAKSEMQYWKCEKMHYPKKF